MKARPGLRSVPIQRVPAREGTPRGGMVKWPVVRLGPWRARAAWARRGVGTGPAAGRLPPGNILAWVGIVRHANQTAPDGKRPAPERAEELTILLGSNPRPTAILITSRIPFGSGR